MNITIVGAGYVGIVTGVSLANIGGHQVTFVERAPERLGALVSGTVPIEEPGLSEAFRNAADRITAVASVDEVSTRPDLVLLAVATPIGDEGEPDLSQVHAATYELQRWPNVDVCVRSTLPPGTSMRLPHLLGRADGSNISTNPEFLRQGSAMADYASPARIVVGRFPETSGSHLALLGALFDGIDAPRLAVSVQAAELIKNVANGFLALKLSFVNEVASLSEEYGVDVKEVLEGIALDPRIGSTYMQPGLGFGGSCLPKELQVLAAAGRRQGLAMHVARAASLVNAEQQDRFARRILSELDRDPSRIALLGLSFKAHTDDLRGSPAITVARRMLQAGHKVIAHDPAVHPEHALALLPGLTIAEAMDDALDGADAVVIATEWPQYRKIDWAAAARRMQGNLLYDGRNLADATVVTGAGLKYRAVGRPNKDVSGSQSPMTAQLSGSGCSTT